jgi:hypothetical protein
MGEELSSDHPGANDPEYRKRRYTITLNAKTFRQYVWHLLGEAAISVSRTAFHLRLNIATRPIANKYREGKMKKNFEKRFNQCNDRVIVWSSVSLRTLFFEDPGFG